MWAGGIRVPHNFLKSPATFVVDIETLEGLVCFDRLSRIQEVTVLCKPKNSTETLSNLSELRNKTLDKKPERVESTFMRWTVFLVGFRDLWLEDEVKAIGGHVISVAGSANSSLLEALEVELPKNAESSALATAFEQVRELKSLRLGWARLDAAQRLAISSKLQAPDKTGNVLIRLCSLQLDNNEFRELPAFGKTFQEWSQKAEHPKIEEERRFSTRRTSSTQTNDPDLVLRRYGTPEEWAADRTDVDDDNKIIISLLAPGEIGAKSPALSLRLTVPAKSEDVAADAWAGLAPLLKKVGASCRNFRIGQCLVYEAERTAPDAIGDDGRDAFDRCADSLLDALLIGARPVPRWCTSFFIAFSDEGGRLRAAAEFPNRDCELEPVATKTSGFHGIESRGYWLPEIQDLIIPPIGDRRSGPLPNFMSYELKTLEDGTFEVSSGNYADPLVARLSALRVHFNPGRTFLLEWEVSGPAEYAFPESDAPEDGTKLRANAGLVGTNRVLWRHYLRRLDEDKDCWSLAMLADFNAEARLSFHDYCRFSVNGEQMAQVTQLTARLKGRQPTRVSFDPVSGPRLTRRGRFTVGAIIDLFLKSAFGESVGDVVQLTDNRARVLTSAILDGQAPTHELAQVAFDGLLAHISSVDPYGHGFPYSLPFAREDEFDKASYRRFWDRGARYMATDHSFVFVGFRYGYSVHDDGKSFAARPQFAEEVIHSAHMKGPYARLYRIFLAVEANLRAIAVRLAELERGLPAMRTTLSENQYARLLDLRHDLGTLSERIMRAEYSSQIQGRELSQLMRVQFGFDQSWSDLERRVRLVEEQWTHARDMKSATRQSALYMAGTLFATTLGFAALRPTPVIDPAPPGNAAGPLAWLWTPVEWIAEMLQGVMGAAALPTAFALCSVSAWALVLYLVEWRATFQATSVSDAQSLCVRWRRSLPRGRWWTAAWLLVALTLLLLAATLVCPKV